MYQKINITQFLAPRFKYILFESKPSEMRLFLVIFTVSGYSGCTYNHVNSTSDDRAELFRPLLSPHILL